MFGAFLVSCPGWNRTDCEPVPEHFIIDGIEGSNMCTLCSSTNRFLKIEESNFAISWEKFFIWYHFEQTYTAALCPAAGSELLALTCLDPGYKGTLVGFDTLYVVTLHDFDSVYHAGDTLNDAILVNTWAPDNFQDYYTLSEYTSKNLDGIRDGSLAIRLTRPPGSTRPFAVELTYKLKNGESFSFTTEDVRLAK